MEIKNRPEPVNAATLFIEKHFPNCDGAILAGSVVRGDATGTLAELVSEFVLRTNNCWIGKSKWIVRSLKEFDEDFASRYVKAFDTYYFKDDKNIVSDLVDEVLQPYGGRLFSRFSLGIK